MTIVPARALTALALLLAAGLAVSGCSSDTNGHPISSGAPAGPLSKPAFLSQMNGECNEVIAKLAAVPLPSSLDDFAGIEKYGALSLQLFPPYLARAKSLVARSADPAELTSKWVAVEESDYLTSAPLLAKLVAAAHANDSARVTSIESQLNATPDHSADIAAFMTSYGLTDCASLESN